MNSVLVLAKLAVNLDVGTIHSTTVPIILYVLRLVARVDSFVTFLIRNCEDREDSIFSTLRDITVLPEILHVLKSKREDIVRCVRDKVCGMLEAWCEQLSLESINKGDDEVVDTNARISCQLHAHLLLLHRNVALEDYNFDVASTISSSFLYLTSRHTWNLDLLGIPENEIFEMLMTQRRNLINWTRSQPQRVLTELMEAAVRVTVGTGIRRVLEIAEHAAMNAPQWAFIGGDRSIGRFTVVAARAHDISDGTGVPVINPNLEMGIEVDLQTAQLTLKSSHLQALETAIAQDPDVQMIFGKKSMQASIVESSENRMWVHLVGRDHDVHFWRTPDQRTAVVDLDRDYAPGEVEECEQWIVPILEPVRMTYMTQPFVLQICMPEKPFPADAEVAMLVGIHPKLGGTWKGLFQKKIKIYSFLLISCSSFSCFTLSFFCRNICFPQSRYGAGIPGDELRQTVLSSAGVHQRRTLHIERHAAISGRSPSAMAGVGASWSWSPVSGPLGQSAVLCHHSRERVPPEPLWRHRDTSTRTLAVRDGATDAARSVHLLAR